MSPLPSLWLGSSGRSLGLGPAGAYLGYELFGRQRDEQAQQQALQRLVESLSLMQPTERARTITEPSTAPPSLSRATLGPEQQFPMQDPTDLNWLTPGYEPPTQIPPNALRQPDVPLPPERTTWQRPSLQQEALLRSLEGGGAPPPAPSTSPLEIEAQRRPPDISMSKTAPWPYGVPPGLEDLLTVPQLPEPKEFAGEVEFAPQVFQPPAIGGATLQTPPPDVQRTVRDLVPGKSWIELLQERPDLRATLVSPQFAQATTMQAEMVGRQAVLAYQRDRAAGMPMEDALAKHGDKMALSEQGREVIATEEKISGALEKREKARQEKAKTVQEQQTREYMLKQADAVEATNPQLAQWLRTAARDPTIAKNMTDFLQGQAKAQETKVSESGMKYAAARLRLQNQGVAEPTDGQISQEVLRFGQSGDVKVAPNGTPYRIVQDEAGNARAVPIPGVPPKPPDEDATIWGLAVGNVTERAAKEGRPVTEQEVLQEAHKLRLETGKAKAATVSITQKERETGAEQLSHLDSINTIMQMLDAGQAKNVGGVWGANTLLSKVLATLKPNSVEAREFEYMVAISRNLASDYLKALTGAAVGDDPTYKAGVPDIENQTLGQFRAALYAYDRNIRNLIEYGNKIRQTGEIKLPPSKRWTPFPAAHVPRPVNTPAGATAAPGETPAASKPGTATDFKKKYPGQPG